MNFNYILLDLDGTLTDSAPGIINSYKYALNALGIQETQEKLMQYIGPSLWDVFQINYQMDGPTAEKAVKIYREYYVDKGIYENTLYPGVPELLDTLKKHDCKIVLASSKVKIYCEKVLQKHGIKDSFDFISGCELNGDRADKKELIAYAFENLAPALTHKPIMTGDRMYDIKGAKAMGITSVGVLYGYGSREELETAGADYLAADVDALLKLYLGYSQTN